MFPFIILAEASIETVPKEIAFHPSVLKHAKRKGKKPTEILLDRSYHHNAILRLRDSGKRGRPDIVYHVLLDITSTPLYRKGSVKFFIHTLNDLVIEVGNGVRPPRAYHRFEGLFEKLFKTKEIVSPSGKSLFKLKNMSFKELIYHLNTDLVIGFSRTGDFLPLKEIVERVLNFNKIAFVIGGFPKGHFSEQTSRFLDEVYSIHDLGLDSSTVVCRLVYELEKTSGITL